MSLLWGTQDGQPWPDLLLAEFGVVGNLTPSPLRDLVDAWLFGLPLVCCEYALGQPWELSE